MSTRRGLGVLFPSLKAWGLPSHLRMGHDAVHLHFLRRFPPGSLGQCHGPQKLVRGAAARDTQDRNAINFPLETLPSAHGYHPPPSEPEAADGASPGDSEPGRGRPPPGGSRDRASRAAPHPDDPGRVGAPAGKPGPGGPTYPAKQCAAVSTQDAATRTPPHRGCPPSCSLTSQGQAPGGAALPPTMRPCARVTLTSPGRLSPHGPGKAEGAQVRKHNPGRPHRRDPPGSTLRSALLPSPHTPSLCNLTWLR